MQGYETSQISITIILKKECCGKKMKEITKILRISAMMGTCLHFENFL